MTYEYNCFKRHVEKSSYRLLLLPHKKSIFDSDTQADDVDMTTAVGRCKDGKNTVVVGRCRDSKNTGSCCTHYHMPHITTLTM